MADHNEMNKEHLATALKVNDFLPLSEQSRTDAVKFLDLRCQL